MSTANVSQTAGLKHICLVEFLACVCFVWTLKLMYRCLMNEHMVRTLNTKKEWLKKIALELD